MDDASPQLGVCSWSLHPNSPRELCERVAATGLARVQLPLDPIRTGKWRETETVSLLEEQGIGILSGMMGMEGEDYSTLESIRRTGGIRPSETWERNLAGAGENAKLAERLGISIVTFHAGFLPHNGGDPEYATMIERLGTLQRVFAERGIGIALETGQESAGTLLGVLDELARGGTPVGVNFDPANMILYGMGDPVESLRQLAPAVRQIHIKDAIPSPEPGRWGRETVAGEGAVRWDDFARAYHELGLSCNLVIEREAGADRAPDVRAAAALVRLHWSVR